MNVYFMSFKRAIVELKYQASYLNLHVLRGNIIASGQPLPQDAREEILLVWSNGTAYSTFLFDTESPATETAGGNFRAILIHCHEF